MGRGAWLRHPVLTTQYLALDTDRPMPLIEAALERLGAQQIIAPGITTLKIGVVR